MIIADENKTKQNDYNLYLCSVSQLQNMFSHEKCIFGSFFKRTDTKEVKKKNEIVYSRSDKINLYVNYSLY